MTTKLEVTPITSEERIRSLDVLRGFALLGILVMNIQCMSMIETAYFNPTSYGDFEGINRAVWAVCHVFGDQKFMALFSMLFGAGIVVFATRLEEKGRRPAGLHYRHAFWLIVFGCLHGYLLWYGDILFTYGICALVAYLLRRLPPIWLLLLGFVLLGFCSLLYLFFGWGIPTLAPEKIAEMEALMWTPTAEAVTKEVAAYRGGFGEQMGHRALASLGMQTEAFFVYLAWRAGGLMLIGMAFYKWGILSGLRSDRFYAILAVVGFGIGVPVISWGAVQQFRHEWAFPYSFFHGSQFNFWGSLFVTAGYIGALVLALRRLKDAKLWNPLAAVGRMAFTNYILQTVIVTFVFYGHGFGLFGRVERIGQLGIVAAVWIFEILLSAAWMSRFRFGPLEWLWRSLTYWKLQPFR